MSGRIEVICGPMFSGKTEEFNRRLRRARIAGKNVVAFKPAIENRFGESRIRSHIGSIFECYIVEDPFQIRDLAVNYEVVGIDEAQFMGWPLNSVVPDLREEGKTIILAGLDTTFRTSPWPWFPHLMAISDQIDKLTAVCVICGSDATLTQRTVNRKPASFLEETVVVGGTERYEARCRDCFEVG